MRPPVKLLCIVLAAVFWIAQVQGTAHGIAHFRSGSGLQDQAPVDSAVCADCAAFSQAGAAPVTAIKPPPFIGASGAPAGILGADRDESRPVLGFRSRAPPSTSI